MKPQKTGSDSGGDNMRESRFALLAVAFRMG